MNIPEVLNVARSFVLLQLNGDVNSVKFLSANYTNYYWNVKCTFKDKQSNVEYVASIIIHNMTREVQSFSSQPIMTKE